MPRKYNLVQALPSPQSQSHLLIRRHKSPSLIASYWRTKRRATQRRRSHEHTDDDHGCSERRSPFTVCSRLQSRLRCQICSCSPHPSREAQASHAIPPVQSVCCAVCFSREASSWAAATRPLRVNAHSLCLACLSPGLGARLFPET